MSRNHEKGARLYSGRKTVFSINGASGDIQDGGGVRHRDHVPLSKYIRNTSTCGTTPTEHLLNAGIRPQNSQRARNSPRTWVGQKRKEKETKNMDRTCISGRDL